MTLQLTVLGGSAAWPNPGQGCSSYLVSHGATQVLIDCGPDTLHELRRQVDYTTLTTVVISHCHADHILDLVPYRYGLIYGPTRPRRRIPLWLPPGGRDRMDMLGDAFDGQGEPYLSFWDDAFDLHEYDPAETLLIDELQIRFAATQHFVECYGVRVDAPSGGSVGYSSDTGRIDPLVDLFRDAHVIVVEATLEGHGDIPKIERGHLTPEEAGALAARCGAGSLVITHLWSERPDGDVLRRAASRFDGPIEIAKPGLRVDV
jgi:ribonuclease BN (tRNA processing enzyme)